MTTTTHSRAAVMLPLGTWQIDPDHSTVAFEVRDMTHLLATIRGRFTDFDATLDVTSEGAQARGEIRVASVTTDQAQRDADLRSAEYLDAGGSPVIHFESDVVQTFGEHGIRIAGRLELKGMRSDIELEGEILGSGSDHSGTERLAVAAEGALPFGPMKVKLIIDVSAIKVA
jgi:polyisoprenoid-binding protein YceI